jgi:hypothetical protein
VNPHDVPLQVSVLALAGLAHALHSGPQVKTELVSEQTPLQRLNPALHLNPHCLFTQVGAGSALGSVGAGQAVHEVLPHVAGELSSAQIEPHRW